MLNPAYLKWLGTTFILWRGKWSVIVRKITVLLKALAGEEDLNNRLRLQAETYQAVSLLYTYHKRYLPGEATIINTIQAYCDNTTKENRERLINLIVKFWDNLQHYGR